MPLKERPNWIGVDIETRPILENVRRFVKEPPAFVNPPPFNRATVKLGNIKDPQKQAEKIAMAEIDYEAEAGLAFDKHASDTEAYWKKAEADAQLSPYTSEITAIGLIDEDYNIQHLLAQDDIGGPYNEAAILACFWTLYKRHAYSAYRTKFLFYSGKAVGGSFDPAHIVIRSRVRRVPVTPGARKGRYWGDAFVDLAGEWMLYEYGAFCSLTKCADVLGLYEPFDKPAVPVQGSLLAADFPDRKLFRKDKTSPVTGGNAYLWLEGKPGTDGDTPAKDEGENNRRCGLSYLSNDLRHLIRIAEVVI